MSNLPSESNASEYYSAVEVNSDPEWSVEYGDLELTARNQQEGSYKRATRSKTKSHTNQIRKSFQAKPPMKSKIPPELVLIIDSDEEFEKELLSTGFKLDGNNVNRLLVEIEFELSSSNNQQFNNKHKENEILITGGLQTEILMPNNEENVSQNESTLTLATKEPIQNQNTDVEEKKHRKKSPKKKKRSVLMDDFFAIGEPEKKKKKKKNKIQESVQELLISDPEAQTVAEKEEEVVEINSKHHTPSPSASDIDIINHEDDILFSVPDYSVEKKKLEQQHNGGRTYIVRLKSKITPHEVEYKTPDHLKFSESVREIVPYNMDTATLIWVEGKTEIKHFFRPSTLGIPSPNSGGDTIITLLLISKDSLDSFMDYPEFAGVSSKYLGDLDSEQYESDLDREEGDTKIGQDTNIASASMKSILVGVSVDDYFIIGLKGSDNRRIEVQVSSETKLMDVLHYYLKQKDLELGAKQAKLIFDDEELDLDGKVGDTELEDEFEVQVII